MTIEEIMFINSCSNFVITLPHYYGEF